ncbi:MAG: hypothetical protein M8467_12200 [Anaerolineae bacterium]|nr:hypothetical protein [Anaerolineae bacterium]
MGQAWRCQPGRGQPPRYEPAWRRLFPGQPTGCGPAGSQPAPGGLGRK